VTYANANWNKVVADGYFWINGSTANYYGAGTAVPVNVAGEASGIGDDCAHYVSSCIGSPTGATAGGLTIPNRAGTYGEPGAARLDELLVGNSLANYGTTYKVGQLVSSISQLTPGDVIGYDWDGSGGGSMSGIDHTTIYVGNNLVDCHATSHLKVNYTLGGATDYFFVHITLPDSIVPTAPANSSPSNGATMSSVTPKLTASAFSSAGIGSAEAAAQWQIYKASTLIYDTGTDTTDLLSMTVPSGKLINGNSYSWQVRYEDNYGGWSSYSTPTAFAIAPVPEPTAIAFISAALILSTRRRPSPAH
jgi:putative amidase-like protein